MTSQLTGIAFRRSSLEAPCESLKRRTQLGRSLNLISAIKKVSKLILRGKRQVILDFHMKNPKLKVNEIIILSVGKTARSCHKIYFVCTRQTSSTTANFGCLN